MHLRKRAGTACACVGSSFDMLRLYRQCKQASTPIVHEFDKIAQAPQDLAQGTSIPAPLTRTHARQRAQSFAAQQALHSGTPLHQQDVSRQAMQRQCLGP